MVGMARRRRPKSQAHSDVCEERPGSENRRLRVGKIMGSKQIFRQNRSAAEKDCLWQPEG